MSWRIGTVPRDYREALEAWPWLMTQLGPTEFRRQLRAAAIRRGVITEPTVPFSERLAWSRKQLEGSVTRHREPRAPTTEENWRSAGRVLRGAAFARWQRIDVRLDGFRAMMLDAHDRAFVRQMWLTGGLDSDRRR
jgi:hypothetical protein